MTKAIVLLTRKKSMSQEEFSTYWKSVHGPLAAKELPGVIRYVQNHITDTFARGGFPSRDYDVDGVVELWFESKEAMLEAFASEGSQNVLQDAANFIERMTVVVVEENEVLNIASEEDEVTDIDPARRALDIEEIKQLKARYFRFIDTKQWRRLRRLFTDDAAFEGLWAGGESPDEFVASLSRNLTEVTSVHHGHMPEIVITGPDTARGIWAMQDYLEWEPGSRGYLGVKIPRQRGVFGYGHYEEEYRREGGEWKISFLRLTRLRIDPIIGDRPPQLGGWLPSSKQDWLQTDR